MTRLACSPVVGRAQRPAMIAQRDGKENSITGRFDPDRSFSRGIPTRSAVDSLYRGGA